MNRSAAGIDVGGTKVQAMLVEAGGRVAREKRIETPTEGEALLDALATLAGELFAAAPAGVPSTDATAPSIGVGMPGLVDRAGVLRFAPHLPGIVDLDVAGGLRRRLAATGVELAAVVVDNDATCAGAAELEHGAAHGASDALLVTLGTGVGGALVSAGAIVRGASNFAGEIGHMVVDAHGPPCWCGHRGCWEIYASGSALGLQAREAAAAGRAPDLLERAGGVLDSLQGEHVVESVAAGDGGAAAVLEDWAGWVAVGLANLANILDPALVVLGGGIVRAGDLVLDPIRRAFGEAVMGTTHRPEMPIVVARHGAEAGAIGAAMLALSAAG